MMGRIYKKWIFTMFSLSLSLTLLACGKETKKPKVTKQGPGEPVARSQGQKDPGRSVQERGKEDQVQESLENRTLVDLIEEQFEEGESRNLPNALTIREPQVSQDGMSLSEIHPDRVFSLYDPSYTGAQNPEGMYFTGAGQDNLLALLSDEINSRESEGGTAADLRLAREIHQFTLIKNLGSPHLRIRFVRWNNRDGTVATEYLYQGELNSQRQVEMQPMGDCPNDIQLKVTCLDQGSGCRIRVVKMTTKIEGQQARTFVVDRHTRGHIFLEKPSSAHPYNGAYWVWYNAVINTELYLNGRTPHQWPMITQLTLKSSAIVNGESSFRAYLRIERQNGNQELVSFTGPMLKPRDSNELQKDIRLSPARFYSREGDRISSSGETHSETLRRVTMINNDGRGHFRFKLRVSTENDTHQESFPFSLLREPVPIDYSRLKSAVQN